MHSGDKRFFSHPNLEVDFEYVERDNVVEEYNYEENVERLMKIHEEQKFAPPQKSIEWLKLRWNLISASDASCASDDNPFKSRNEFIMDKSKPYDQCSFTGSAATRFGERYEPVADHVYESLHGLKLHHMNLVVHPKYPFLGASIDGLAINEKTKRINLTEFKVPYKRPPHFDGSVDTEYLTATNHVKKNYWVQMQLQMEVLDVNENDYLDLKVVEPAEIFHLRDRPGRFSGFSFINPDDPKTYIYSFDLPQMDVERYENERPTGFSYWSVEYYHLVTIHRDKDWFAGYLPLLKKLWDDVLVERNFDL